MAHHQDPLLLGGQRDQGARFGNTHRQRLFDKNMFARPQGRTRQFVMAARRGSDHNGIHGGILQHSG